VSRPAAGPDRHAWRGTIGAVVTSAGVVDFRVWAPSARTVDVVVERAGRVDQVRRLTAEPDGMFSLTWDGLDAGTLYRYRLDGQGPFPDPASRSQPRGVHGPSCVVDPAFPWTDHVWTGVPLDALVLYELHVGTFSTEGTFAAVTARLPELQRLGVTALQLMPVADFAGERNWGYDGVAPFAPARCYGHPDDLRRLVDTAHGFGLAVLLDVVYNHLGPDGAYLSRFSPHYFTERHPSPWGAGIDLDGAHSRPVRAYLLENALHWIHEYHFDGLRLDATHALHDDSATHLLAELAGAVHGTVRGRHVHVTAEDDRNLATIVTPAGEGGWGLDAVWADDFHHQMRRLLAGDDDGYYRDFSGTTADLAATIRQGWFYTGQYSAHRRAGRGTDPSTLPPERFVICLQNHDQVGNRARGERLHHQIAPAAFRAATVLLLTAPQTPLIFMGQEWAASTPFQYFTDHAEPLGRLVTEGRRREFAAFAAFGGDPAGVPDPQAMATFVASRLRWSERDSEPHAATLRLHRAVLALRRSELGPASAAMAAAEPLDADTVGVRRTTRDGGTVIVVARLRGAGDVDLARSHLVPADRQWTCRLTSEDSEFSAQPAPPQVVRGPRAPRIRFRGPATVILVSDAGPATVAAGTAR
jgi:maltooligosyltrehalose trehalohydrolase